MGLGEAVANPKMLDGAAEELSSIAGQRAVVTKAKKSIATFKLRTGMPIGARVTLRGDRMWEFLDRLINIALPRVRDFRGVSSKAFDGRGNYTLGVRDHFIFPGDRLREDGQVEGPERDDRDDGRTGRPGQGAARRARHAVRQVARTGQPMATRAMRIKAARKPKFMTRTVRRCRVCGRPRSVSASSGSAASVSVRTPTWATSRAF